MFPSTVLHQFYISLASIIHSHHVCCSVCNTVSVESHAIILHWTASNLMTALNEWFGTSLLLNVCVFTTWNWMIWNVITFECLWIHAQFNFALLVGKLCSVVQVLIRQSCINNLQTDTWRSDVCGIWQSYLLPPISVVM